MSEPASKSHEELMRLCEEIGDEHTDLMELVLRIEETREPAELATLLSDLHTALRTHFSHETRPGGFYETLGASSTEYSDQLRILSDEHTRILSMLSAIEDQVRQGESNIVRELSILVDLLHKHERQEYDLAEQLLARSARAHR